MEQQTNNKIPSTALTNGHRFSLLSRRTTVRSIAVTATSKNDCLPNHHGCETARPDAPNNGWVFHQQQEEEEEDLYFLER